MARVTHGPAGTVPVLLERAIGQEHVGTVRARHLDVELDAQRVVAQVRREPHLQVPARLQVGHEQVPGNPPGRPAHTGRSRRVGRLQVVPELKQMRGTIGTADVHDPHPGLFARPHIAVAQGVGRDG